MNQFVPKWQYRFGLIGQRLEYSFSPTYFKGVFEAAGLLESHSYEAWSLPDDDAVVSFLEKGEFAGCNVTIPYKQIAAKQCDLLVGFAAKTGAVNTIRNEHGTLIGYNTDVYGVLETIRHKHQINNDLGGVIEIDKLSVLILGSGGASLAVRAACDHLLWNYEVVSRTAQANFETYQSLAENKNLTDFDIIVNTTPLGMTSLIDQMPDIQYDQLNENHLVFDVVYNPKKTLFLERAEEAGAAIVNGELMLKEQANLAWKIWNN